MAPRLEVRRVRRGFRRRPGGARASDSNRGGRAAYAGLGRPALGGGVGIDATGVENATIFFAIVAAGVVLGVAYQITRRLGTSIVAHALFNLLPAIVIIATR